MLSFAAAPCPFSAASSRGLIEVQLNSEIDARLLWVFSAASSRGLIEVESSLKASGSSMSFPRHRAAASLKFGFAVGQVRRAGRFPRHRAAASLKYRGGMV